MVKDVYVINLTPCPAASINVVDRMLGREIRGRVIITDLVESDKDFEAKLTLAERAMCDRINDQLITTSDEIVIIFPAASAGINDRIQKWWNENFNEYKRVFFREFSDVDIPATCIR